MRRPPRPLIALYLLALLTAPASAQEKGTVTGKITDKRTRHAVPFATVTVLGAQRGGLSDAEGRYFVSGVAPGTYEVRVQFLGYRPESRPGVVVVAGKPTTLDIQLEAIVVQQEKVVEVTAERQLVEVRQGATIRSVNAGEIRNLPVETLTDVLKQQAGITVDADQIHVRGGRTDETVFMINGVANRDLITGQSTAGQLNARSVAEVNVATGAYDVRYGNALSGVVEIKLKEGGDRFDGGITTTAGRYGARAFQVVAGGPDPLLQPAFRKLGMPGTVSSIVDVSGTLYDTRRGYPALVLDDDAARNPAEVRRHIGVVFQAQSLDVKLTAAENLRHQGHLYGLSGRALDRRPNHKDRSARPVRSRPLSNRRHPAQRPKRAAQAAPTDCDVGLSAPTVRPGNCGGGIRLP